jgi:sugar lactone lactonase YvrE
MHAVSILTAGLRLGESPRWHEGELWFADWGANMIAPVDQDGLVRRRQEVGSFPISFDWLPNGSLVVVSGSAGLLHIANTDNQLMVFADLRRLSRHPWNEIAVHHNGNIYVNGIGYDFSGPPSPSGQIALVRPDGTAESVASGLAFPNGMLISPDGSTLVMAESHAGRLSCFDIHDDGTLSDKRTWAQVPGSAPDGICWTADGDIWFADVPNRRCVLVREGGDIIDSVQLAHGCFACVLGGPDLHSLFVMTADWPAAMDPTSAPTGAIMKIS